MKTFKKRYMYMDMFITSNKDKCRLCTNEKICKLLNPEHMDCIYEMACISDITKTPSSKDIYGVAVHYRAKVCLTFYTDYTIHIVTPAYMQALLSTEIAQASKRRK